MDQNYTTIEYLEATTQKKRFKHKIFSIFNEIKILLFIFVFVSMGMIVFTNATLFINSFWDSLSTTTVSQLPLSTNNVYQDNSISSVIEHSAQNNKEIQTLVDNYKKQWNHDIAITQDLESLLQQNIKDYDFKFNTLPPTNRLMVPSLGVNDPIVTSKYIDIKDFTNWNFDEELKKWVVKYPTTPDPWLWWNTLIFGHTSQERWKYNHYGMTFANIAKLKMWDIVQVIRNGELIEYKIINIVIVYPQHVNEEYLKYQWLWKSYLTLMWCYPIWSSKQRILVIAEELDQI